MKKIPLSLLLWLPVLLLALGLLAMEIIFARGIQKDLRQLSGLLSSSQYISQISDVIHQLQIERGEGVLFLEKQISIQELSERRRRVDQEIDRLTEVSGGIVTDELKKVRKQLENFEITSREAFLSMSKNIDRLLAAQMDNSRRYYYQGFESTLSEIVIFEKIKDNFGKLRALMSRAAARNNQLSQREALELNELFVGIRTNSELLALSKSLKVKDGVSRILSGNDWQEISETYEVLISAKKNNKKIESRKIFLSATKVVNELKVLIEQEFVRFNTSIGAEYEKTKHTFWSACLILIVTTLSAGAVTFYSIRRLIQSIQSLVVLSRDMSTGDYSGDGSVLQGVAGRELSFLGERMHETGQSLSLAIHHLKKSNESLEQFAFATSHDLQEPVKKISSYVDFLEMSMGDSLNKSDREYVEKIKNSCQRAIDLIKALVEFSQLSNEKLVLEPTDLNQVIDSVIESMNDDIKQSGVQIKRSEKLPTVSGNTKLLQSIFRQLFSNAIKFRKKGEILNIDISSKTESDCWKVSFGDNGIGFDMTNANVLFKPFGRIHAKSVYPGSGMGLASVKRILDLHKAQIEVMSELGKGTSFTLSFKSVFNS